MKNRIALIGLTVAGLAAWTSQVAAAELQTNAAPARLTREQWQKLTPEEREARVQALRAQRERSAETNQPSLREQILALPPAEREAKLKEIRARQGLPPLDPEFQKRREELLLLSPEEQRAKLEELRKNRPAPTPVDEKAREQRRAALEKKLAELRAKKKAEGKLSSEDERRLEQLERAEKIMQANPPPKKPVEQAVEKPGAPASPPK